MSDQLAARSAIVLFAHGSRDAEWAKPFEDVAARIALLAPTSPVVCAYLELMQPDLTTAVQKLWGSGVNAIAIWPMFLSAGRHVRDDLPTLVDELKVLYPGLTLTLHPPIMDHPGVLHAMVQAIARGNDH